MADNWEVGDLALCVNVGDLLISTSPKRIRGTAGRRLRKGAVYTVVEIRHRTTSGTVAELLVTAETGGRSAASLRFRKIDYHTPDAEDEETIRLLKGEPCNPPSHTVPSKQENACG